MQPIRSDQRGVVLSAQFVIKRSINCSGGQLLEKAAATAATGGCATKSKSKRSSLRCVRVAWRVHKVARTTSGLTADQTQRGASREGGEEAVEWPVKSQVASLESRRVASSVLTVIYGNLRCSRVCCNLDRFRLGQSWALLCGKRRRCGSRLSHGL